MSHQDRRDPLPKWYQFGDARLPLRLLAYCAERAMGDKGYEEYLRRQLLPGWNVIEGDHH